MIGRTAYSRKTSKFEDSDDHMSRPRAMSELPHRHARSVPLRLRAAAAAAAVGSEASGAHHRAHGIGRGTSPRSPLHEKRPAGAVAGAGSRVAELEAKLGKAHDQLTGMREQLAAAEKARKDARAALGEAKKRFAAKKRDDVATPAPVDDDDDDNNVPAEQAQQAEAVTADVKNGGNEEIGSMSSPASDVLEPVDPSESENNIALIEDGDGKKGNLEAEQLRTELIGQDKEVYELRAKLMVKDMEVDELRMKLTAKKTESDELTAKLVAKNAEITALQAGNADLTKMVEEASDAVKETAAKAGGIEHALRESAAREARLAERLRASERAREALEAEMQRSRVQSEQWRKAAEEAAVVLGAAADHHVGARGVGAGRDKRRHGSAGDGVGGDRTEKGADDESSGGKRKSAGGAMRVLSNLWKKGQK